jgi:hypothetical protein
VTTSEEPEERNRPEPHRARHLGAGARAIHAAAHSADSYGLLLALLIVDYVVLASNTTTSGVALVGRALLMGATLLLALRTSEAHSRAKHLARWATAVALIASVAYAISGDRFSLNAVLVMVVLLLLVTPLVILRRILNHASVTIDTVLGALCTYILIGLLFASVFIAVNAIGIHYFARPPTQNRTPDLLYLSFVTLTTVGFGDVVAAHDFGRVLVVLEALIGQIFLVTLVARFVSMFGVNGAPEEAERE